MRARATNIGAAYLRGRVTPTCHSNFFAREHVGVAGAWNHSALSTSRHVVYGPVPEDSIEHPHDKYLTLKQLARLAEIEAPCYLGDLNTESKEYTNQREYIQKMKKVSELTSNIDAEVMNYGTTVVPNYPSRKLRRNVLEVLMGPMEILNQEDYKRVTSALDLILDLYNLAGSRRGPFSVEELKFIMKNEGKLSQIEGVKEIIEAYKEYQNPLRIIILEGDCKNKVVFHGFGRV